MSLSALLQMLRRRWWVILIGLIAGLAAAAGVTSQQVPSYQNGVSLYVSTQASKNDIGSLLTEASLAQQRVASYVAVATSTPLGEAVKERTGLDRPGDVIASQISASLRPGTVVIDVVVTDVDPAVAHEIAAAVGEVFDETVVELEGGDASRNVVSVEVLRLQSQPTEPVSPKWPINLLLGGVAGGLVGTLLSLALQQLDRRFGEHDELAELTGAPLLGRVPQGGDRYREIREVDELRSIQWEALRMMRTNLRFVGIDQRPTALIVTSARPGEGKSSTAAGLARVLSQGGKRVLLVDADMRRPRVAEILGVDGGVGLSDCLIGEIGLGDAVQVTGQDGLSALAAGRVPPNPSELLGSPAFGALIEEALTQFDVVLVDSPPVLAFTDAAAMAPACRGVVLVARHRKVLRDEIRRAAAAVETAGGVVVGCVANGVPGPKRGAAYGYGYGYSAPTTGPRERTRDEARHLDRG